MGRHIWRSVPNPEPGDSDLAVTYNARTGRPVRKIRRVTAGSPFVDSAIAVSDEDGDDSDSDIAPLARARKRKRSPSPPVSVVSELDKELDKIVSDSFASDETHVMNHSAQSVIQLIIKDVTINISPGHTGPVLLQVDIPSQLADSLSTTQTQTTTSSQVSTAAIPETEQAQQRYAGFLDLPAELRNEIYRLRFVTEDVFNFDSPSNFTRSAAFLRTCKQVHSEARSILYSENHFLFVRKTRRHGSYWEREWNEVGFKAVRKFLQLIGPDNIAMIRNVTLLLEDATPCLNPSMATADDRRFVRDEVLMSCLRMLAQHAKLQKLQMHFRGRRRVERTDYKFLEKLTDIRADEVKFIRTPPNYAYPQDSKQEPSVETMCLRAMVRKRKMFD